VFDEFRYRHLSHALEELPKRLQFVSKQIEDYQDKKAIEIKQMIEQKEELSLNV
jgi:hypothetical protein